LVGSLILLSSPNQGLRLQIPNTAPHCFVEIMTACWEEASLRPTFGDLITELSNLSLPTPRTPHPRVKGGGGNLRTSKLGNENVRIIHRQAKKEEASISLSPRSSLTKDKEKGVRRSGSSTDSDLEEETSQSPREPGPPMESVVTERSSLLQTPGNPGFF
jgi:hypothetical protein